MKVFELAKELSVQSKDIIALMKENGEVVKHTNVLTDEQIEFIRSEMEIISVNAEKEKVVETKKEETKKKTDKDYKPDEMISCRSLYPGVLLFTGDHTGMTYTFNGVGDRRSIEYQDLKAGMLQQKASMFNPNFIIEDADLIDDEHWRDLKEVYESMYDETDIKKIMNLPIRDFEKVFEQLPITAKQTIITLISSQIENGTFEQYNKAKVIDNICGTRFDLKM